MNTSLVLTPDLKLRFLDLYRKTGLLGKSATGCAVSLGTINKARKDSPDFAAAVEQALADFRESLEEEAYRRAVTGWEEPIFSRGEHVGERVVHSDRILELMLKRHIPEYRDRATLSMNVAGGVLVVPGTKETADEWERRNRSKAAPDAASG
jgi:hypothetical protein